MDQMPNPYRRMLQAAVLSVLSEHGIESTGPDVLETLTEVLQIFICKVGQTSKNYSELSDRPEPLITDVILAIVKLGVTFTKLTEYVKGTKNLPTLKHKQLNMLQAGQKHALPSHIPPYCPPFPDLQASIRCPTNTQPAIEYEAIREKFATQKRDVEGALTTSMARTSDTHNLSTNYEVIFPVIVSQPWFPTELLPCDDLAYEILKLNSLERIESDNEKEKQFKEEPVEVKDEDYEEVNLEKMGIGSLS